MFSRFSKLFMIIIMLIAIIHQGEAGTWTQKADMPTGRYIAGSAVVDGKIYVIGGASAGIPGTAVVEEYDPATDTWTTRTDMPTARDGLVAAAVDGIIYAIGGWPTGSYNELSTVEAYDPATDTWVRRANMPTARAYMSGIAVVDGIIYVIGGVTGANNRTLSTLEAYDPATDTWTKKADMPTARRTVAACVVDGRIYVLGGNASYASVEILPTVEVYDPATDTWTQAPDMPRARNHHTASVADGKMYIIGGCDKPPDPAGFMLPIVDMYDPGTDTWTTAADFPNPRWDLTANVVDGKIYTLGGRVGEIDDLPDYSLFLPLSTVEEFDPGLSNASSSVSPAGKMLETWGHVKNIQ
jgi:N-acetylneuraminic acid mutarotase